MSSLRLVIECHQRGLLTKEAAESVLETRNDMIKTAMRKVAVDLVVAIQNLETESTKVAGAGDFLRMRGAGGGGGFLSKFKTGAKTTGGGWSDVTANLAKMMALAGLTAGATTGVGALIHHSRDKKLQGRIQESYKQMFEEVPEIRDRGADDPAFAKRVERNFGILAEVAPSLAAIPVVAGTWVRSTAVHPAIEPAHIGQLADTQRKIDEMREAHRGAGPKLAPLQLHNLIPGAMASGGDRGGGSNSP